MRKNLLLYIAVIVAVATVLFLFNREYKGLTAFAELSNRHNQVLATFQNLRVQINNAAVINPDLLQATNAQKNKQLFATDSTAIIAQIKHLQNTARDSVNIKIANELFKVVPAELSWLFNSNVPDSIVHQSAPERIEALEHIDSLLSRGIARTGILIEERKKQLEAETGILKWSITVFILLSALLFTYITFSLFQQRSKRRKKEKELETVFNRVSDSVISVDSKWRYTFLNDVALARHTVSEKELLGRFICMGYKPRHKGDGFLGHLQQSHADKGNGGSGRLLPTYRHLVLG